MSIEVIFVWAFFSVLTGAIAHHKNRSAIGWGLAGFVAGILATIVILCLKKVE